jgi:hypothetical protein
MVVYLSLIGHALTFLTEVLCYDPEGRWSIPDKVISFYNLPNTSSGYMTFNSPPPLTEMCTRNFRGTLNADDLTALWVYTACCKDGFNSFTSLSMESS